MMIIKYENGSPIEGTQIPLPKAWENISNPTLAYMQAIGYEEYVLEPYTQTLAEKQAQIWEQIKAERERRNANGVFVSGKWFHTDVPSRLQHLGMVIAGATLPAINWKTMDGTFIIVTPTIATAIYNADFTLDITNFAAAETHKTAMILFPDPSVYDFSVGWAATYEVAP